MESTVAALLLVTSTVILSSVVIVYAVDTILNSFSGDNTNIEYIKGIQSRILNDTSVLLDTMNSTMSGLPDLSSPTPSP